MASILGIDTIQHQSGTTAMTIDSASSNNLQAKLLRGSTQIKLEQFWGYFQTSSANSHFKVTRESHMHIDSPSTTSSTTYKWQIRLLSGTQTNYVNWDDSNGDTDSQIVLMEIGQ